MGHSSIINVVINVKFRLLYLQDLAKTKIPQAQDESTASCVRGLLRSTRPGTVWAPTPLEETRLGLKIPLRTRTHHARELGLSTNKYDGTVATSSGSTHTRWLKRNARYERVPPAHATMNFLHQRAMARQAKETHDQRERALSEERERGWVVGRKVRPEHSATARRRAAAPAGNLHTPPTAARSVPRRHFRNLSCCSPTNSISRTS